MEKKSTHMAKGQRHNSTAGRWQFVNCRRHKRATPCKQTQVRVGLPIPSSYFHIYSFFFFLHDWRPFTYTNIIPCVRCIHNYLRNAHLNTPQDNKKEQEAGSSSVWWRRRLKCQQDWLTVFCILLYFWVVFFLWFCNLLRGCAIKPLHKMDNKNPLNQLSCQHLNHFRCLGTFDWASWRAIFCIVIVSYFQCIYILYIHRWDLDILANMNN